MYFPLDPNKNPALWESLRDCLLTSSVSYVLENRKAQSVGVPRKVTFAEVDGLINRMQTLGYVRIGASRLVATPPHFGVSLSYDGKVGDLTEYIALDGTKERRGRDISFLVELMFYELPNLSKLIVPLELNVTGIPGVGVNVGSNNKVAEFFREPFGKSPDS